MKRQEFDNILNECLERMLIGGETVEQCLASYPDYAGELEPLLQTSLMAKKASEVKPRPEFRERARYQLRAALREMEQNKEKRSFFFGLRPHWATVVVSVLVLLMASGGTAAAAGGRVALVGSATINIGLGKLFAAFAQMADLPFRYKTFHHVAQAERWLADDSA